MANSQLFKSASTIPVATGTNAAGGSAYELDAKSALAQYAATGCFGNTFYVSAETQMKDVLRYASQCPLEFVAKVAVYSRQKAYLKDMPAFLLAYLTTKGDEGLHYARLAAPHVLDNGRMVRNFVQILRSGQLGRKSLGTAPKRLVKQWLASRHAKQLVRDSIGQKPSLADIIKMVHPKPESDEQRALFAYLIGKPHEAEKLPEFLRNYEAFKKDPSLPLPEVPTRMLTSLPLTSEHWAQIADKMWWQELRMNLNTLKRHGVFNDKARVKKYAQKLKDPKSIAKARVFPYQLLMAYKQTHDVPSEISVALQDAMELAVQNVPKIEGQIVVCPDVSGSMDSPITGGRTAASHVQCRDVAALVAAALARVNPSTLVLPFQDQVIDIRLNPRDSIMTLSQQIAKCGWGGTSCSAPLRRLNEKRTQADLVIMVSDNQSWVDDRGFGDHTQMMEEWAKLKKRCPKARLVCIDLTPNAMTQTSPRPDILNIGGFSDQVFTLIQQFAQGNTGAALWVKQIEETPFEVPAKEPVADTEEPVELMGD